MKQKNKKNYKSAKSLWLDIWLSCKNRRAAVALLEPLPLAVPRAVYANELMQG